MNKKNVNKKGIIKCITALVLCACVLFTNLICARASSMVQVDNGIIGITQWSRVYNSGSWVENSSIPPKATDKDYCWRFSINSSVTTSGKPFALSFDRVFYLGNGHGTSVSLYEIDYAFRDGTRVVVTDLSRVYTSGQKDSNSYTYHFFSKTFNKDLAYIDVYFRIGCTCTDCTHYVTNYSIMMPEKTVQEVIKEEIKVSNNILDNIKSMLTYIGNLPFNIADKLSSSFSGVSSSINSKLQSVFDALPDGIKNKLTSLFSSLETRIDTVKSGVDSVVVNITALKTNVMDNIDNLLSGQVTLGDLFETALDNVGTSLKGKLDVVGTNITTSVDNVVDGIERIFVPDDDYLADKVTTLCSKFCFVDSVVTTGEDLKKLIVDSFSQNGESPPKLSATVNFKGKEMEMTYLDLSFYEPYKKYGDTVLSGILLAGFGWAVFTRLPNIINGLATGAENVMDLSKIKE